MGSRSDFRPDLIDPDGDGGRTGKIDLAGGVLHRLFGVRLGDFFGCLAGYLGLEPVIERGEDIILEVAAQVFSNGDRNRSGRPAAERIQGRVTRTDAGTCRTSF